MAVGTVTLSEMTMMLRAVTRHYTSITFSPDELEHALNASQGKVFSLLPIEQKRALYGGKDTLTPAAAAGEYTVDLTDITADAVWDIAAVRRVQVTTNKIFPMFKGDLNFVLSVADNDYRQGVYWARHGDTLYLSEDMGSDSVRVFYIRKPVDMGASDNLDVPDEYRRFVVLTAALDLLSYAEGVPADSVASARQEVVAEARTLGLYADHKDSLVKLDAISPGKDEEPVMAAKGGE